MTSNVIMDFLKFPPSVSEFSNYETKIHSEIASQISDVRTYTFTLMKSLQMEEKKKLLRVKKSLDKIKTNFDIILYSSFTAESTTPQNLTLHHETTIVLDFLLLDRFLDLSDGLRKLDKLVLIDYQRDLFNNLLLLIHSSIEKLEKMVDLRKMVQNIAPSKEFFTRLLTEYKGDIAYLESIGIIHEYDQLAKPLRGGKKEYYEQLKRHFHSTCLSLLEKNRRTIPFAEFSDLFKNRYPAVEWELKDLEKIAEELHNSGVIGIIDKSQDSPLTILLADDTSLQKDIIQLAKQRGYTTQEEILESCSLPIENIQRILKKLEDSGLAIVDSDYTTGTRVYFPGIEEKV